MLDLINTWMTPEDFAKAFDPQSGASQENSSNFGQPGAQLVDDEWAKALGYSGSAYDRVQQGDGEWQEVQSKGVQDYLKSKGLTQKMLLDGNTAKYQYYDKNGKAVGPQRKVGMGDKNFAIGALIAAGIATGGIATAAGAAGSGGAAAAGAGGAAGSAGAGGYALGGTLGLEALPAAGGYTTAAGLNAGALSGMEVAGAAGAAGAAGGAGALGSGGGGLSEAAYGWNPAGYTGGVPEMAGGGGVGGGMDWGSLLGNVSGNQWMNLGTSLLNGYLGSRAAGQASEQQLAAMREANALQKYMYDQTRQDNMPALQARNNALSGYQGLLKDPSTITSDPGYQFGMDQGTHAIGSNAAAHGSYYSGATLKALDKFGQDYAGSKFDQSLNRYGNLAGLGQVGTNTIGQAGMNYGNQAGQNLIGGGNARGAATLAGYNSWQNALNQYQGYNNYQNWLGGN